ncbi:hypothetical protein MCGE09_00443 [Thaumarchaeota archaeon SCGC AB-539-E09]|nr:hypothetical protein MCGE09_00443 [Thaumarchaeota archaeon SCGC AB-539-E09]
MKNVNGVDKNLTTFYVKLWLFFLFYLACFPSLMVSAQDVPVVLVDAENAIFSAFKLIQEVEKQGGDVHYFVERLDEASDLVVEAWRLANIGELDEVELKAERSLLISNAVKEGAISLVEFSIENSQKQFWNSVSLRIGVSMVIVVTSFFSWRMFKRYFLKRMLTMRPEVVNDET